MNDYKTDEEKVLQRQWEVALSTVDEEMLDVPVTASGAEQIATAIVMLAREVRALRAVLADKLEDIRREI